MLSLVTITGNFRMPQKLNVALSVFQYYANKRVAEAPICPKWAENHVLSKYNSTVLKYVHCSTYNTCGFTP